MAYAQKHIHIRTIYDKSIYVYQKSHTTCHTCQAFATCHMRWQPRPRTISCKCSVSETRLPCRVDGETHLGHKAAIILIYRLVFGENESERERVAVWIIFNYLLVNGSRRVHASHADEFNSHEYVHILLHRRLAWYPISLAHIGFSNALFIRSAFTYLPC